VLWLAASSSSVAPLFGGGEVAGRWRSGRRWCAPWAPASTSRPTSGCGSPRRRRGGWWSSTRRRRAGTCRSRVALVHQLLLACRVRGISVVGAKGLLPAAAATMLVGAASCGAHFPTARLGGRGHKFDSFCRISPGLRRPHQTL
jgi:hypothetical protein